MKRTLYVMILLAVTASMSMALLAFSSVFNAKYKPAKDSALAKGKCAACHVGMTKTLNPYGADLKAALNGGKKLTPEVLAACENKDSDKDGVKNIDEIKAGTLPGDPKSK
jgi:mono/diheme cytochrome c family protein